MRQVMWLGGDRMELRECARPEPGPGEIRVRVHACGICMTEVHFADGSVPSSVEPPCVLGHEWSGTVDATGPGVTQFALGDPVAGSNRAAFADYLVLPVERTIAVPAGVSLDAVTFLEPVACCVASVDAAPLGAGETALVTGAGPMGQVIVQLLRMAGMRVIVSEPSEQRRTLALRLGADATIDPVRESLADAIARLTGGHGVAAAWETAGRPAPLNDCLNAVRPRGAVVMVGVNGSSEELSIPLFRFHRRQNRLLSVYGASSFETFRSAMALMPGLNLDPLISHRFALSETGQAFELARSGRASGKVLVVPAPL
jgi:threonine dehydrogenase-like Zn-dependent dehydrogenase